MGTRKRLNIMLQGKVISKDQYELLLRVANKLTNWEKTDKQRFITHLAMAVVRTFSTKKVAPTNDVVKDEIKNNSFYNQAQNYYKFLFEGENIIFNSEELIYLYIHIINFLKKE